MPKTTSKSATTSQDGPASEEQLATPPADQASNETSPQDGAIEEKQSAPESAGNVAEADSLATVAAAGGDAAEADAPTTVEPNAIEVVAKVESFRRAGFSFSRTPTVIRLSELDEQQFKQLYGEPMLAVKITYVREG